jgi:biotin carboxyl carrier protein
MAELLRFGDFEVELIALPGPAGAARVKLDGESYEVSKLRRDGCRLSFVYGGQRYRFDVAQGHGWLALDDGTAVYRAQRLVPGEHDNDPPPGELVSKMPGTVLQLLVESGTEVSAGTPLLILEAMKMEHQIAAPADGRVDGYPVGAGQRVMPGQLLVNFTPAN